MRSGNVIAEENALNIFTDGSCKSTPRRGGIGYRFVYFDPETGEEVTKDFSPLGYKGSTNQEMELLAVIEALKTARAHSFSPSVNRIRIITDSMYVCNGSTSARFWARNKWLSQDGNPIENEKLWREFLRVLKASPVKVEFQWVKAHKKNEHNNAADKLAKRSASAPINKSSSHENVRRKMSNKITKSGSVGIEGQRITIRIVSEKYYFNQKLTRYRYEVISKASNYRGNVDFIYADQSVQTLRGDVFSVVKTGGVASG